MVKIRRLLSSVVRAADVINGLAGIRFSVIDCGKQTLFTTRRERWLQRE